LSPHLNRKSGHLVNGRFVNVSSPIIFWTPALALKRAADAGLSFLTHNLKQ
jgi:hypothetical protein